MTTDEFIDLHRNADVRQLALQKPPSGVALQYALQQIEGWQTARRKLPSWAAAPGIVFPPRLSMEQCSSEATARYKRQLIADAAANTPGISGGIAGHGGDLTGLIGSLTDLTGGLGADFFAMAPLFRRATYVERLPELVATARHNGLCLGITATTDCHFVAADAEDHLRQMAPTDVVYLDPARRDGAGRKVVRIEECSPDIGALQDVLLAKSRLCVVKLSPMLDISAARRALPATSEVHVVSLDGECKEVVLLMNATPAHGAPRIVCAMLHSDGTAHTTFAFSPDEEAEATVGYATSIDAYLYEPDAAILKAGAYKLTALRHGVDKLAPHTHLYTSPQLVGDFPGRRWRVCQHASFAKRELRAMLADVRTAELAVRGFPATVATLRRQLNIADGPGAHLIATTLADGSHRLLRVEPLAPA
ncbi:MAG: hypothetical protein IJS59_02465 [Bacteroidaceae bacterium]|nr:hypothetical protein [Bacteroidaceae bacterium]